MVRFGTGSGFGPCLAVSVLAMLVASSAQAKPIEVAATNSSDDVTNIADAIDRAKPGDTILLGPGVFDLSLQDPASPCESDDECSATALCFQDPPYIPVDCTDPTSDCRCHEACVGDADCLDGELCTDGQCIARQDAVIPLPDGDTMTFFDFAYMTAPRTQLFVLDVPNLTIKGTVGAGGQSLTTITVDRTYPDYGLDTSDGVIFLGGAPGLTFKDLTFGGTGGVMWSQAWIYWGGWTFENVVFDEVAGGPSFFDDERTLQTPGRFIGNTFLNSNLGIHVATNTEIRDNFFECSPWFAIYDSAYASITLPPELGGDGLALQRTSAHDIVVTDNVFVGGFGRERVGFYAYWGGEIYHNTVSGNEFVAAQRGVATGGFSNWIPDDSGVSDITVKDNTFDNVYEPVILGYRVHDSVVKDNTFIDTALYWPGVRVEDDAYGNLVKNNDFRDAGYPGLLDQCDDGQVAVQLVATSHDNHVREDLACDQVVDNGTDNVIDGHASCPSAPATIGATTTGGSLDYSVVFGESGAFSTTVHGLARAETQVGSVGQGEWVSQDVTIPEGTLLARFALYDEYTDMPYAYDLDIELWDIDVYLGGSYTPTATEAIEVRNPVPGDYQLWVNGWYTQGVSTSYTLFAYYVGTDAEGNLTVTGPSPVVAGTPGTLEATWGGLDTCTRYLGLVEHSGMPCHDTLVEIETDGYSGCAP